MWKKLVIRTSRLTPISRPGIMIGNVIPIVMPLRNGSRERTSGNAAAVPTTVEISVTSSATLMLRRQGVLDLVVPEHLGVPVGWSSL